MQVEIIVGSPGSYRPHNVEATIVGAFAVHRVAIDDSEVPEDRWKVTHIRSKRATQPGTLCCEASATALANALQAEELNWEFDAPEDLGHTVRSFPAEVQADMARAKAICYGWPRRCDLCRSRA